MNPPTMRIPLLLGLLVLVAAGGILFVQEQKKLSLEANLKLIKLKNLRIGVGSYGNKKGTGLFGSLVNEGKERVSIATLLVSFVDDTGQIVKTHEFSPVNRFSWLDPKPMVPGETKEFGFLLDDIVPESWSGNFEAKLIKLKFKD